MGPIVAVLISLARASFPGLQPGEIELIKLSSGKDRGRPLSPTYVLAVDHRNEEIVLSVRGTKDFGDAITISHFLPEPFLDGWVTIVDATVSCVRGRTEGGMNRTFLLVHALGIPFSELARASRSRLFSPVTVSLRMAGQPSMETQRTRRRGVLGRRGRSRPRIIASPPDVRISRVEESLRSVEDLCRVYVSRPATVRKPSERSQNLSRAVSTETAARRYPGRAFGRPHEVGKALFLSLPLSLLHGTSNDVGSLPGVQSHQWGNPDRTGLLWLGRLAIAPGVFNFNPCSPDKGGTNGSQGYTPPPLSFLCSTEQA